MLLEIRTSIPHLREKSKPLTIAVTGNAGSGKTKVCDRFRELGVPVILLDALAREVVKSGSPILTSISDRFGRQMISSDGTLDRSALRKIVIRDEKARQDLEALMHPPIIALMHERISRAQKEGASVVLIEVPLLFENNLTALFDRVLLVCAAPAQRVDRLMSRDQVSEADARGLLAAQIPDEKKRDRSDFIINNSGSIAELIKTVDRLYQMIYQKTNKAESA